MVTLIQAIILSVIQGITEWFPISSSGHLALAQYYFGFQNVSYDVFLHFAGIFAVLFVFKREILNIFSFNKESIAFVKLLIIALIPAGIVGFLLSDWIEWFFSDMRFLGVFFILSGIIIYSTKYSIEKKSEINNLDALFIGLIQAIAVLPGISRSGSTISAGLYRGLSKRVAIRFSFLMSIPLIIGASILKAKELAVSDIGLNILVISFIITFFVSILSINLLIRIIGSDKFYLFGVYNLVLGILVILLNV